MLQSKKSKYNQIENKYAAPNNEKNLEIEKITETFTRILKEDVPEVGGRQQLEHCFKLHTLLEF